jgi:hypothetical protein
MGRNRIKEISTNFNEIFEFIYNEPKATLLNLETSGGVAFSCIAKTTRDNRRFIDLPHNNRIYEADWGYYFNDMGKDGQRVGQYSIPINCKYFMFKGDLTNHRN